jgi:phospholipase C
MGIARRFVEGIANMKRTVSAALAAALLVGCSAGHGALPQSPPQPPQGALTPAVLSMNGRIPSPIRHVVIIFQENRSTDNLFQHLPGADVASFGTNSQGKHIPLHAASLDTSYDIAHSHTAFLTQYDAGKMNGFGLERNGCPAKLSRICPFGYVPSGENGPYMTMAEWYVFGDRMFQTNQGPSYPAHQYIISGDSLALPEYNEEVAENPGKTIHGFGGGCDAPSKEAVTLIDSYGYENQSAYPCFERPVLSDLVDAKGLTWRYYQDGMGEGLWKAMDSIRHVRYGGDYAYVTTPPDAILTDIKNNNLANVVWLTPRGPYSDHAGSHGARGPSWVAAVVNAIGHSPYWNSTAILVTWDDWGGWYDHVKPPMRTVYELGFRVPLIVISPYAKAGYVSHVQYEFGSLLKFTETSFGLASLGTTDAIANDLTDCFDFGQKPRPFKPIPAPPFVPSFSKVSKPPYPDTE